ncbi:MAG TPA: hypothetical protein VNJ04_10605 [Gemmatimonadaceae bacterium]|nr:hypothetical protein [Gemmatimonadaceae bacterium]
MRTHLIIVNGLLLLSLGACGGSSGSGLSPTAPAGGTPPGPPAPLPPTGPFAASGDNWSFRFQGLTDAGVTASYGKRAPLVALEGSFDATGGSVTAVMQPCGSCFGGDGDRLDLQVATAPDAEGNYVLSGTVKFSNTQCFATAAITRRARGRVLFPDVVGDTQRLELIAEATEDLKTMYVTFVLVTGTCPELSLSSGVLTRS